VTKEEEFYDSLLKDMEDHPFGVVTQRGYHELADKIETHTRRVERRFRRWLIIGLTAFACIALTSSAALIGFGFLLAEQSNITHQIQDQRKDSIRAQCLDQNKRHDSTAFALHLAMKDAIKRDPHRAREISRSSRVSLGLIDALAPHRNCEALVKVSTESKGGL
jgi:hypothetical protein